MMHSIGMMFDLPWWLNGHFDRWLKDIGWERSYWYTGDPHSEPRMQVGVIFTRFPFRHNILENRQPIRSKMKIVEEYPVAILSSLCNCSFNLFFKALDNGTWMEACWIHWAARLRLGMEFLDELIHIDWVRDKEHDRCLCSWVIISLAD